MKVVQGPQSEVEMLMFSGQTEGVSQVFVNAPSDPQRTKGEPCASGLGLTIWWNYFRRIDLM